MFRLTRLIRCPGRPRLDLGVPELFRLKYSGSASGKSVQNAREQAGSSAK